MLLSILFPVVYCFSLISASDYGIPSEYWEDDPDLEFGDAIQSFPVLECQDSKCPHKVGKREVVKIDTMKDFIKYLLRGNKTRDDDRNIDSFIAGNITLGVVIDAIFVSDKNKIIDMFTKDLQSTPEFEYLRNQSFKIIFFDSSDRPIPNVNGIISMLPCESSTRFDKVLTGKPIVHIAITGENCPILQRTLTLMLPIQENGGEIRQILTDLRTTNTLQWKQAVIVAESSTDEKIFDGIVDSLSSPTLSSKYPLTIMTLRLHGPVAMRKKNFAKQLSSLDMGRKERNFIMVARQETALWVHETATENGYVNWRSQWFYILTDPAEKSDPAVFLPIIGDGQNLAFLYNTSTTSNASKHNLDCFVPTMLKLYIDSLYKAIREEEITYFQQSEEVWLRTKPSANDRSNNVFRILQKTWRDSQACGASLSWQLQAVEIKVVNQPVLLDVSQWDGFHGLSVFDDLFPHFTGGLRGRVVNVTSLEFPPWEIYKRDDKGNIIDYTGLVIDLAKEVANSLNFTMNIIPPPDGQWGTRLTFSRWTGMIEMVRQGSVAFAAAGFTVTPDRMAAVNFTLALDAQPYTFMFARPKLISRALLFIQPYTPYAWLTIFAMVLAVGPLVWVFNKVSPYYQFNAQREGTPIFDLWWNTWYCIGAILFQGQRELPMSLSGRMVVGVYWLFVIVVLTAYSGNLVAFLTFPSYNNPINTLEDLLENKNSLSWGILRGTAIEDFLKTSDDHKYRSIFEGAILHEAADDNLLEMIRTQNHVYIEWKTNLQFIMRQDYLKTNSCDFSLAKEEFFLQHVALAFPKDSPLLERVNTEIMYMQRGGLIEHWRREFWPEADRCSTTAYGGTVEETIQPISLTDIQGSFYVLLIGCLLGALIFVIERYRYHKSIQQEGELIRPYLN